VRKSAQIGANSVFGVARSTRFERRPSRIAVW
jgi:hypothetical protein